ncbi:MAG: hypothetical protein R2730_12880 [Chitinophagales bacterium]
MTDPSIPFIIQQLEIHQNVFAQILTIDNSFDVSWKPEVSKWCLLDIACHLLDEEIYDFRSRVQHTLENPHLKMSPIDPEGWVNSKKYMEQNYSTVVQKLLEERNHSIQWLLSLQNAHWNNSYEHPVIGSLSAKQFLANWLAHDYLHLRQIMKLKFQYLEHYSKQDLRYAGSL